MNNFDLITHEFDYESKFAHYQIPKNNQRMEVKKISSSIVLDKVDEALEPLEDIIGMSRRQLKFKKRVDNLNRENENSQMNRKRFKI